jgi:hypothetical protein
METGRLVLHREVIAVCSEIRAKYINPLRGQVGIFRVLNLVINTVITGLYKKVLNKPDFMNAVE